jgi:methanogenic corrinoid protein MtbC1
MEKIGKRFKANEEDIPEVLIAARAMNQGMGIFKPELVKAGVKPIGENLVKVMARGPASRWWTWASTCGRARSCRA